VRRLLPVTALLLICGAAQSASTRGPEVPRGPDIRFADLTVSWAAGAGGILASQDAGVTWQRQVKGRRIGVLDAVDARHAWALTSSSLLATSDGGRTWLPRRLPEQLKAIDFANAETGWALAVSGRLLASRDFGTTWRSVSSAERFDAICLTSPTRGLAARDRTVFATRNGGASWKRTLHAPLQGSWTPTLQCRGSAAWLLLEGGVAAGSQGYAVYSSTDGLTWRLRFGNLVFNGRARSLGPYAGPYAVVDASTAFLFGFCPACGRGRVSLERTHDGHRWIRSRPVPEGYWPLATSFADGRHGLLLTSAFASGEGVVWKTRDSGRTWRRVLRSKVLVSG